MPKVFLLVFVALASVSSVAQTSIEGSLRDRAGKSVPDARVTLQPEEGKTVRAITDSAGSFHFSALDAGRYTLQAQADGFYASIFDFVLRPRQPLSFTIELQPKESAKQTVEVSAHSLLVDPQKTGSSYTFTQRDLENLPDPLTDSTNDLVNNLMPGASDSHDNFLAVRGTEFSLHEFINGVSFLDNTQPQFSPGISPQIFETVDLMTGGFTPEYGNRFGGVLDIVTRSGADVAGHGDVNFRGATIDTYDLNADYGGQYRGVGYYFFVDGFTSGRFLDPPEPHELYDFGKGSRATAQFDWHPSSQDAFKLLLMGGGDNFQQPNISDDQAVGRDAQRHLRQQTAILNWLHTFSARTLISTSLYERTSLDRVAPTTDPITPFSEASRSPLTLGIKSDLSHFWSGHFFKAGVDLLRLRENDNFFFDGRGDPDVFPAFTGGAHGGQASAYLQDHFSPVRNLTLDLGLRYDYFDLVDTGVQTSPRAGLAYHFNKTNSVLHAAYSRYFSPPPIEYSLLASFIGHNAVDPSQRVGDVRAYTQNYFEAGWAKELRPRVSLELNAYLHTGHNSFENHEISISRIFVPINFHTARSEGAELVLDVRQLERIGISGRFQYALQKTYFYGPITGGFAGDEPLTAGERIVPAFDQTHTGTAQVFYHSRWRGFWTGSALRYGSGTIIEGGNRLPQHFTADLASGMTLWNPEPMRLDVEFDVTNVSDNVYQIAKESEEIPIQYAPSRTVGGSLKFHF
ncbi:MAG TPA: TonB-dependent receptor [Candidatus Polarisedimenticolia bacterium]|nr:TonB-dependent receptor [Candidatus Polarisedimenticolia bacterium]